MFHQSTARRFYSNSLAILTIPVLASSGLAQKPAENENQPPKAAKIIEPVSASKIEKFNQNIKNLQKRAESIFGSEDAKELAWAKSKEEQILYNLTLIKYGPNAESSLAKVTREINDWRSAIDLYIELKYLREDLDSPAKRAELPDAVFDLEKQKLSRDTEIKLAAARQSINKLLNSMRLLDVNVESNFVLRSFAGQIELPKNKSNELLSILRDPSFKQNENLRISYEKSKPIWTIAAIGFGATAITFLMRSIMQAKNRAERHFRNIKESQQARGTYDQQLQHIADTTGNPIGKHKPEIKKGR